MSLNLAIERHEGSSDLTLLLGHATGFCKETWRPVVRELRLLGVDATIISWDARGHGASPSLELPASWWTFGEDLVRLIERLGLSTSAVAGPVVGVGHSMGGAAVVMAEVLKPATFAGMVLVEPVLMAPPRVRLEGFGLAIQAAKRRSAFPSRADARAAYRTKALFARWDSEAFEGYIEGGLAQVEEGVALACRPDVEADVFVGSADTGLFGRAHELDLPVRLVISDDPGEGLVEAMRVLPGMIPNVTTSYLAGTNHLVVMEQPNLVAREVGEHLALLGFWE